MARIVIGAWVAALILGVGVATASFAQAPCVAARPPPQRAPGQTGIVLELHFGPGQVCDVVLEATGVEGREISNLVAEDLERSGLFRIVDPTELGPYASAPDIVVQVSATRLDDDRLDVELKMLDFATRTPIAD